MEVPVKEGSYNKRNIFEEWKKQVKNYAEYGIVRLDDLIKNSYCNIWFKNI